MYWKNTTGKRNRKLCYYQCFSLDLSPSKFPLWCLLPVPTDFNLLGNCKGTVLYPKHFHQSRNCMHIKEGCIAVCINYDSYWTCQIIRNDKQDLYQSSFLLQKQGEYQRVYYNHLIKGSLSNHKCSFFASQ